MWIYHVVCSTMLCLEFLCEFIHLVGGSAAIECDLTTINERFVTAARLVFTHTQKSYARQTPNVADESTVHLFSCSNDLHFICRWLLRENDYTFRYVIKRLLAAHQMFYCFNCSVCLYSVSSVEHNIGYLYVVCLRMNMNRLRMYFSLSPSAKGK